MTREEANRILDSQKDGTRLPKHTRPFSQDGIDQWLESSRMAQSTGTGQSPNRDMAGNQSGFDQKDERNQ